MAIPKTENICCFFHETLLWCATAVSGALHKKETEMPGNPEFIFGVPGFFFLVSSFHLDFQPVTQFKKQGFPFFTQVEFFFLYKIL